MWKWFYMLKRSVLPCTRCWWLYTVIEYTVNIVHKERLSNLSFIFFPFHLTLKIYGGKRQDLRSVPITIIRIDSCCSDRHGVHNFLWTRWKPWITPPITRVPNLRHRNNFPLGFFGSIFAFIFQTICVLLVYSSCCRRANAVVVCVCLLFSFSCCCWIASSPLL